MVSRRFLRFCAVGGVSAASSLGLLYLLADIARIQYLLAYAITFAVVNVIAYLVSRRVVFQSTTVGHGSGLLRYFAVVGLGLLINLFLMSLLVDGLGLHDVAAGAVLCVLNAPLNYLMHRRLTFGINDGALR